MLPSHFFRIFFLPALILGLQGGCRPPESAPEVVVYTALDREFSAPIFEEFTEQTGIRVRPKYDSEASKTVGLVNLIMNERERPRCDVFWNNEIINTYRLEDEGLLQAYRSPVGEEYPAEYRSPEGTWYGFAARARILLVNRELVSEADRPTSIRDLADPKWSERVGIAKPLFGTTASHAACLFATLGSESAEEFFRRVAENARIYPGNRQVAQAVATGQIAFGLTDTDDAMVEIEAGMPVEIIYPDQEPEGLGTLFIPNTLTMIEGCRHPEAAQQLIDFLLSPEIEARLAEGPSAQIPLHPGSQAAVRVATPQQKKAMSPAFAEAADVWERSAQYLRTLMGGS